VSGHHGEHEFEVEPIKGLPEVPPEDEKILWQGSPDWRSLARHALHARKVAFYFALLVLWRISAGISDGHTVQQIVSGASLVAGLAVAAVGILTLLAWLNSRATVYTITSRRVVMRFGIALTMAVNFPYRVVQSADLRTYRDGTGDIPLEVTESKGLGYVIMWPNARAWHFGQKMQPMLRSVPDARGVAETLADALAASLDRQAQARAPRQREEQAEPRLAAVGS